ncbi:MAG: hypothetical protein ACFE0Q_20220 [Anaerolineae bacterium]
MMGWLSRRVLVLMGIVLAVLLMIRVVSYRPGNVSNITETLTQAPGCTGGSCFLGIVPDDTEQDAVYQALNQSPYVAGFRMAQVEFGLRQMFVQWSGEQPDFLIDEGYITLIGERAETVELTTNLYLGEIMLALGMPDHMTRTAFNLYLHYDSHGIMIESVVNCDALWYSSVRVIYRSPPARLVDRADDLLSDYCR